MVQQTPYTIYHKLFVRPFYQAHLGLFLFLALLFLGAVQPGQFLVYQQALLYSINNNRGAFLLLFACIMLYFIKVFFFQVKQLRSPQLQFLKYLLAALPKSSRYSIWLYVIFYNTLPANAYLLLCIYIGFLQGYVLIPLLLSMGLAVLIGMGTWISEYYFQVHPSVVSARQPRSFGVWKSFYTGFAVKELLYQQKMVFLCSKALSYLLIVGILHFFEDLKENSKLSEIIILSVVLSHLVFLYQQYLFENRQFLIFKNLPYSTALRFWISVKRIGLFLSPEFIWIFVRFPLLQAASLILFMFSLSLFLYYLVFFFSQQLETYIKFAFFFFLVVMVLILYHLAFPLSVFLLVIAWTISRF